MLKANLTQALYTVATTIDHYQRVQAEDYVNSIINNRKYLPETTTIIVEMFGEPKLNRLLTILLKKMIKGYKELSDEEMHLVANQLFQSASRMDTTNMNLYAGLVVDYLYEVIGLTDPFVFSLIHKLANDFLGKFDQMDNISYFEVLVLKKFCKKALSVKMTRHYLFSEFKDIYEDSFKEYRAVVIPNDKNTLIGYEIVYTQVFKLLNNLANIYDDYNYLTGVYASFEYLISSLFVDTAAINEVVCKLIKTQFKCLETSYLIISMKSDIFERLAKLLLEVFFNLDNYSALDKLNSYSLDFYLLRYLVNILDDFLNDEETGISVLSDNNHSIGLQAYVESKIQIYPSIIDKIISNYISKEINSILNGETEELEVYFNIKSKQFKDDPMICALKLLSVLFEFYLFRAETYMENLTKGLLHQLEVESRNETEFYNNPYNFYKLNFIQENMHRINKLISLGPIIANFMKYDISNLSFFIMYFIESYFYEYDIDESLLIEGLQFAVKIMNGDNYTLAVIATNIILLIANKGDVSEHREELIDLNGLLTRYLVILQSLSNQKSDYLMHLLDILLEVIEILFIDNKTLETILNFLFTLITIEYNPDYLTIVSKSTEIFTDVFIKAPSESLTPDVIIGVGKLVSIQIDKFMSTQQITYLESGANLLLGYIGKFEIVCDQAITQIVNKNPQFISNFVEISNSFVQVVISSFYNLIDYYIEDLKFNFIHLSFMLLANVFSKVYFVINHNNFIYNYIPGSTSYYIDIKTDNYKNVLGQKVNNKSQIELIVPLAKTGETAFIHEYLYVLQKYMQELYLAINIDELGNCFDVLDFVCMLFPFMDIQIYEFVFDLFNKINGDLNLVDAVGRNNLFLAINRIIARIILTYPSFLLSNRQKNFTNIISYLKVIVYSGK